MERHLQRHENDVSLRLLLSFSQFLLILFSILVFITHAHWNVTVNVFETLSAEKIEKMKMQKIEWKCEKNEKKNEEKIEMHL